MFSFLPRTLSAELLACREELAQRCREAEDLAVEKQRLEEEVERSGRALAEAEGKAQDLAAQLEEREVGHRDGAGGGGSRSPFSFRKKKKNVF